jgi:hypothetical protein
MERRSSTARPRRYDNAEQADHQPSDGVASALPGTAPRRGVICRYPPCGRRGPELPLRGSPVISSGIYRLDDLHQLLGRGRLDTLARVLLLGGQPTVPATDREAQDPVVADLPSSAWSSCVAASKPATGPRASCAIRARARNGNTSPDLGRRWRPFIEGPAAIRVVTVVVLPRFWAKNSAGGHSVP